MKTINSNLFAVAYLVVFAVLTRILPHPWNATAIGALALFSGRELSRPYFAYLVPVLTLFLSDLFLGFHSTMFFVYGAVALTVWMGQGLKAKWSMTLLGSLISSVSFFVITNFGVWTVGGLYPQTMKGLLECYAMAWPFFRGQWLGDLLYTVILFGSFEFVRSASRKYITF